MVEWCLWINSPLIPESYSIAILFSDIRQLCLWSRTTVCDFHTDTLLYTITITRILSTFIVCDFHMCNMVNSCHIYTYCGHGILTHCLGIIFNFIMHVQLHSIWPSWPVELISVGSCSQNTEASTMCGPVIDVNRNWATVTFTGKPAYLEVWNSPKSLTPNSTYYYDPFKFCSSITHAYLFHIWMFDR